MVEKTASLVYGDTNTIYQGLVPFIAYAFGGNYLNEEYCGLYIPQKKIQDYNKGVSESLETVLTDLRQTPFGVDFVLCNFADLFHA